MAQVTEPPTSTASVAKTTEPDRLRAQVDGPARLRLLARIHKRYQTVTETLEIGSLRVPFTRIADPDRVLDEVADEVDRRERRTGQRQEQPQHLPYWAELWDSAFGLGKYLAESGSVGMWGRGDVGRWKKAPASDPFSATPPFPHFSTSSLPPTSFLDLGCGMGLAGTVAAALGGQVVFADLEPPALLFARLNSLPYAGRVRTRQLNWQTDRLAQRFDVILGADILYERGQWEYLDHFWRAHLSPSGCILLGEPGRQTGDLFIDWAQGHGWTLEQFALPVASRPRPVRVFRLTAGESSPPRR